MNRKQFSGGDYLHQPESKIVDVLVNDWNWKAHRQSLCGRSESEIALVNEGCETTLRCERLGLLKSHLIHIFFILYSSCICSCCAALIWEHKGKREVRERQIEKTTALKMESIISWKCKKLTSQLNLWFSDCLKRSESETGNSLPIRLVFISWVQNELNFHESVTWNNNNNCAHL